MPSLRHARVPTTRFLALAIAASAAAMIGLGSVAAHADPTGTPSTPSGTATTATTDSSTTATSTTATSSSSTSGGSTSSSGSTGTEAPGPQCAGKSSVLTPVLCIPTGSGENQATPVGTDGFIEFAGQVVNNGPAVSAATVTITLPSGLRLADEGDEAVTRLEQWWSEHSDEDGTPLACTTNTDGSITCATGSVSAGANFLVLVDLEPQDDVVAGTTGDLSVALESSPNEGTFPPTTVHATVDFVGTAHLQVTLTPAKATVTVGKSLTLVATVHNLGPNPAVEAGSVGFVDSVRISDQQPFMITNSQPFPGESSGTSNAPASAFRLRSLPARMAAAKTSVNRRAAATKTGSETTAAPSPTAFGFWPIGTIAVGATATVQVVVAAEYAGQASLNFFASSADESCDDVTAPGCENIAMAELTSVDAATTTAPSTAATTATRSTVAASVSPTTAAVASSTSSAASLPNTGFQPAPWVGSGAVAILLGGGLIMLAMPRRRCCGRYR